MRELGPGKTRTHFGGNIASYNIARPLQNAATSLDTARTQKICFWKPSEIFLVSTTQMLPAWRNESTFAHQQCCRHNVSSFHWGLSPSPFALTKVKALGKRYSQLKQGYKIKTCISGWPNGTTKWSQLARKPFNCLTTTAQSSNDNKTTWVELAKVAKTWLEVSENLKLIKFNTQFIINLFVTLAWTHFTTSCTKWSWSKIVCCAWKIKFEFLGAQGSSYV